MRKESCNGEQREELPWDPLAGRFSVNSPHQIRPWQLHCVKIPANRGTSDRWEELADPCAAASATTGNLKKLVYQHRLPVHLTMTCKSSHCSATENDRIS
jgi:hypothetical protein